MKGLSKLLALAAVMAMLWGTGVVAFASSSPRAVVDTGALASSVSASAGGAQIAVNPVSAAFYTNAQAVAAQWFAGFGSPSVYKAFDLSGSLSGPTDISISVPGITAGQKVGIIHLAANGTWENIPVTKVGKGYVVGTFTSLSPVAIVTAGSSPKTGEGIPAGAVVGLVLAAGALICIGLSERRKNETH